MITKQIIFSSLLLGLTAANNALSMNSDWTSQHKQLQDMAWEKRHRIEQKRERSENNEFLTMHRLFCMQEKNTETLLPTTRTIPIQLLQPTNSPTLNDVTLTTTLLDELNKPTQ